MTPPSPRSTGSPRRASSTVLCSQAIRSSAWARGSGDNAHSAWDVPRDPKPARGPNDGFRDRDRQRPVPRADLPHARHGLYGARHLRAESARRLAVRDYALECRGLLDGEEVIHRYGDAERAIRFRHLEVSRPTHAQHIPIYIAGDGPKALARRGRGRRGPDPDAQERRRDGQRAGGLRRRDRGRSHRRRSRRARLQRRLRHLVDGRVRARAGRVGDLRARPRARRRRGDDGLSLLRLPPRDRRVPATADPRSARHLRAGGALAWAPIAPGSTRRFMRGISRTCSTARRLC